LAAGCAGPQGRTITSEFVVGPGLTPAAQPAILTGMQWLARAAIIIGTIIGTVLVALVVAIGIQVWHERSTVDLPMKDD
jgi:hypothetical protein